MRALGIIAEYNPFHFGHLHHLKQCKKMFPDKKIICILSSNFVQRGEPAFVDKWLRTSMALEYGADLVIELPFVFSCRSAEFFARGSITILHEIRICDTLVFGAENPDLSLLSQVADILTREDEPFQKYLKDFLNKGLSFPVAREKALFRFLSSKNTSKELNVIRKSLNRANNILAIEYLKTLRLLSSHIKPVAIPRIGSDYHSNELGDFSSATAIRNEVFRQGGIYKDLKKFLPAKTYNLLNKAQKKGLGPVFFASFFPEIILLLRRTPTEELAALFDVKEGFENRMKTEAQKARNLEELINALKTKRYTRTRIQRILVYLLTNFTKEKAALCSEPSYIRILGFSQDGRKLIKAIKNNTRLPVTGKPLKLIKKYPKNEIRIPLELERLATDIYNLKKPAKQNRSGGMEWTTPPVIKK